MVACVPAFFRLTGETRYLRRRMAPHLRYRVSPARRWWRGYRPFFVLPGKPGIYDGGWRRTVGTGCPRHDDGGVGTGLFRLTGETRYLRRRMAPHRGYRVSPARRWWRGYRPFSSYRGNPVSTTEDGAAPWVPGVPGTTNVRAWLVNGGPRPVPTGAHKRRPYALSANDGIPTSCSR